MIKLLFLMLFFCSFSVFAVITSYTVSSSSNSGFSIYQGPGKYVITYTGGEILNDEYTETSVYLTHNSSPYFAGVTNSKHHPLLKIRFGIIYHLF